MVASLNATHASAVLDKLSQSTLVRDGCITVVSLAAIREAIASRWTQKQTAVYDYAEREFEKRFEPIDQFIRVSEVAYLLIQPYQTPAAGMGRGVRLLRDILEFFLGKVATADLQVAQVTELNGGVIRHGAFGEASAVEAGIQEARTWPTDQTVEEGLPPVAAKRLQSRQFVLDFKFHPVWSRKKNAIVSNRLKPIVLEAAEGSVADHPVSRPLTLREQTGIDLMVLDYVLDLMAAETGARFGLHVPIHITTLNSTEGRQALFARLAASSNQSCGRLAICLAGLQDVPRLVLDPAVAGLRPFVLGVVGQAPSITFDASVWRGSRLSAVSYDLAKSAGANTSTLQADLQRFTKRAEIVSADMILHGVSTRTEAVLGWGAGFTDLSGPFLGADSTPSRPIRFESHDLYA